MAKISARGAREQARWRVTLADGTEYLYVLRSDGKVLVRTAKVEGKSIRSTYSITGFTLDKTLPIDSRENRVEAVLVRKWGAEAVKWEVPR
jgi:hypothetical protein